MNKNSTHNLKIKLEYFIRILDGTKNFEIRKNDRNYKAGDTVFVELDTDQEQDFQNIPSRVRAKIGYVCEYEQKDGYIVFSLTEIKFVSKFGVEYKKWELRK